MLSTLNFIFNSNFYVGTVAIGAGAVAYLLYRKQKKDSKKDAANIILLEVQNAERVIMSVGESVRGGSLPNKYLLPTESWAKHKYLFVRDFDRDQWDLISDFYNNCKLYDEAVAYNDSFFKKNEEQVRVNMLRMPADFIREHLEGVEAATPELETQRLESVFAKATKFQNTYLSRVATLLYSPSKPLNDAKVAIENLRPISNGTIGSKLKKLAGLKV